MSETQRDFVSFREHTESKEQLLQRIHLLESEMHSLRARLAGLPDAVEEVKKTMQTALIELQALRRAPSGGGDQLALAIHALVDKGLDRLVDRLTPARRGNDALSLVGGVALIAIVAIAAWTAHGVFGG